LKLASSDHETDGFNKAEASMNRKLFEVAVSLLEEDGWDALNLDRIAERAGVSRATVWRHGITRTSVEQELRRRLAGDYRDLLWPVLASSGSGAERLEAGIEALCELADRHLALLAHSEMYLHDAVVIEDGVEVNLLAPFVRFLEEGAADGSLTPIEEPWPYAALLLSAVVLPYVHLRVHHAEWGWTPDRTRAYVRTLLGDGYLRRAG
jgi:AcrR family transcriptional regulator